VTIHIPRRMRDDLERLARDRGVSLGELVRQAISELLTRVQNGELVINTEGINPLHRRVAEAVTELASRVDKPGMTPSPPQRGGFDFGGSWLLPLFGVIGFTPLVVTV
jgi:antitoxin (DNA-binding transcriptional repressor) of toxin-antitoxin stability system